MSSAEARNDAPFGARLVAFTLATSALLGAAVAYLSRQAFGGVDRPDFSWEDHKQQIASLEALSRGEMACELLIAALLLIGVVRYGRGIGDALVRNLSLGAGIFLTLDAVRAIVINLIIVYAYADSSPEEHQARMRVGMYTGLALRLGGLAMLTAAFARGQRLLTGGRPWWPAIVAVLLPLYPLALWIGRPAGTFRGDNLIDWLSEILAIVLFTIAGAAVHQAARIDSGPVAGAWVRAAAGLERYRDATALRVLVVVCLAVFLFMARLSGLSPLVTLAGLGLLGMIGPLIGLFQIAGLVRVSDAPAARPGFALALPLLGVGIAAECGALVPIVGFVLGGGRDRDLLRHFDPTSVASNTQLLALVAAVILLLTFRSLASADSLVAADTATHARARCNALLIGMISLVIVALGLVYTLPGMRLDRDDTMLIVIVLGFGLLATAVWFLTVYLRMLKELAEAMASVPRLTKNAP